MDTEAKQAIDILFHQTDIAWAIEQAIPIVTALIAVLVAYLGFRHALKTQAKDYQHQFQIRTYEAIIEPLNKALNQSGSYMALLNGFLSQVSLNYNAQHNNYFATDLKQRPREYIEAQHEYLKALGSLMGVLENILIIEPKLDIFVTALSSTHWDISKCREKISQSTYDYLTKELLEKNGEEVIIPPKAITLEEKERIEKIVSEMNETIIDGTCYIIDLKIALQNLLLGEVYNRRKLSYREPIDPSKKVICIENYDALKKYFKENHPMGQEQEKIINDLKQEIVNEKYKN